jgi:hypothetical protein
MKSFSTLMLAFALTLTMISLNDVFAQDDLSITDCQSRCGTRTDMGQIIGNYQAIAACRDRCARQYWDKTDKPDKKKKGSLFDD